MNEDFEATALEEMKSALDLTWKQLAPLVPWGDSYVGVSIGGRILTMANPSSNSM